MFDSHFSCFGMIVKWYVGQLIHAFLIHLFHINQQQYKKDEEDKQGEQWIYLCIVHCFGVLFDEFEHGLWIIGYYCIFRTS